MPKWERERERKNFGIALGRPDLRRQKGTTIYSVSLRPRVRSYLAKPLISTA